jgi:hypothetical protein
MRAVAIVDCQGNDDLLGIWTYCGTLDGVNRRLARRRLAGDECTSESVISNSMTRNNIYMWKYMHS